MARTQLRLDQLTGSFKESTGGITDSRAAGSATLASIALQSGSMVGVLSEMASAIKRINGGGSFASAAAGVFGATLKSDTSNTDALGTTSVTWSDLYLGDGAVLGLGEDQDVTITHDGGTGATLASAGAFIVDGAAAVTVDSDAALTLGGSSIAAAADGGAFSIDATGAVTVESSASTIGIGVDAVAQAINIGTGAAARTISIGNETGATALDIDAGTGGIAIDAQGAGTIAIGAQTDTGAINIGAAASARVITVGNVTGATQVVLNAGTAGIALASTGAGDITIDSDDTLLLDSDGALELNSSAGAIGIGNDDIDQAINIGTQGERTISISTGAFASTVNIGNATGASAVTIKSGTGAINIGANAVAHEVTIGNTTGASGLTLVAGSGGIDVDSDALVAIDVTAGGISLDAAGASNFTCSDAALTLTAGAASTWSTSAGALTITSDEAASWTTTGGKLTIKSGDSGEDIGLAGQTTTIKGKLNVDQAATFDSTLTVTGDFIVQGSTTTVSSSNTVFQDSIIGLGVSGSAAGDWNNVGDRAIIFARAAAASSFLPAINFDGSNSEFEFATFSASPSSGSMGAPKAGIPLKTGHLKPITDNGATLGDVDERWSDLFLAEGGVINWDNGDVTLEQTSNTLVMAGGTFNQTDTTEATSTIDGSLQTDGGLSVAKSAVIGDDLDLLSDGAILNFGAGKDITFTHDGGTGMGISSAGNLHITSSAGSITVGATLADGQTLKLGKNGAVETIIAPHGTAGSEKYSVINTAGTTDGTDAAGAILLSSVAGGIGLAWADGKDLWAEGGSMMFVANEDKASCIQLHADAGTSQTIHIVNDAGTAATEGAAAIQLLASAGGINIKSNLNNNDAILLTADGGTDGKIKVHNDQGTDVASIHITSDVGGVKISSGKDVEAAIHLSSSSGQKYTGGDQNDSFYFENSPIKLEDITAPSTVDSKLYNVGGDLFWNGTALSSQTRSLFTVTSSLAADTEVYLTGSTKNTIVQLLDSSDSVSFSDVDVFETRGRMTQLYVNGQLLITGSVAQITAGTRDYRLTGTTAVKFGFALEIDDVIQVIDR